MKSATIIIASLMGSALAAPAGPASNAPAPGSREDICIQTSAKVFDKCFETRQRDEPADSLSERCNKERDDAKTSCLDNEVQNGTVTDGDAARKKKAECAVPGNRAFAQCMKDKVLQSSGQTREDCEKKRKDASEACINGGPAKPSPEKEAPSDLSKPVPENATPGGPSKPAPENATPSDPSEPESTGQTIEEYCQVMGATSNDLFDKQFCLDSFKSCGNPTSLDDTKAKDCADKIMSDKFLGKETSPIPTDSGSEEQEPQEVDQQGQLPQPDPSLKTCQ